MAVPITAVVMPGLVPALTPCFGKKRRGWPGRAHKCPARFVLEGVHGIDSTRFQLVANHLDTKGIKAVQHQNIVFHGLLKHIPWATVDRLVEQFGADGDPRGLTTKAHLIAMLYAQFCGLRSLRGIETNLRSHAGKLYHLGGLHGVEVGAFDGQCFAFC
jgi:hypothetical protein